jgi:hypothetical protein
MVRANDAGSMSIAPDMLSEPNVIDDRIAERLMPSHRIVFRAPDQISGAAAEAEEWERKALAEP